MVNDEITHLVDLSRTPVLLVASDFDGTLAPIVSDPMQAQPLREAMVALHGLSKLPQTHVAVISGRALGDLSALSGFADEVHLVGSHGSEFDPDFSRSLSSYQTQLHERLRVELAEIAGIHTGFIIESKPAAVAFHYRNADVVLARKALDVILSGPARYDGVHVKHGKKVVELSVVAANKGEALTALRHRLGARAVLYLGDDQTDEDAFATLSGTDLGVKVGDGPSVAAFRVPDCSEAARLLARVADLRESWLKGAHAVPIERHSILSDQRTVALLTPEARVVWMCMPRIDSPALFSELLGSPSAGYFAIDPGDGSTPARQSYVGDTFLLRTEWPRFSVTDYLDCAAGRPLQRAGRTDLVRVIEGTGRIRIEFAPRLDFGRQETRLRVLPDGLHVEGSLDPITLRSSGVIWNIVADGPHQTAVAEIELPSKPIVLELRYGLSTVQELRMVEPKRREQTARFWSQWAETLNVPPSHAGAVRRSALVIKALTYGPSGAIAAAGTTSLPEQVGGVRNWDYRYCWLRDAAMAANALVKLGDGNPGMAFLDWVLDILDREDAPESLRPLYTVRGHHLGSEGEIAELPGYRGSRPVRVGNAAAQQLQLDVFGPILELVARLAETGAALSVEHWRLTEAVVKAVGSRWHEPDHGIWEIRRSRRHYVHSKVMCWVAVDRALRIADVFSGHRPEDWIRLRELIAGDILRHGWNEARGCFSAIYGDSAIDAATLSVGISGLLSPIDPRFVSTVDAVERTLRRGPTVYRYLYDDGLPGREGGFHLCSCWLMEAYALIGRIDEARNLFEGYLKLRGPTDLLPEEYCPKTGQSLGNYPQLYSHVGIIDVATLLAAL